MKFINAKIKHSKICDPLWEKGYFRANIKFSPQAHIAKNSTLLVILLFVTGENHAFASIFSRWSGVDLPLLALAASLPSCGRRLRLYCVIEIPRAISFFFFFFFFFYLGACVKLNINRTGPKGKKKGGRKEKKKVKQYKEKHGKHR